jgi:hypothetical protein
VYIKQIIDQINKELSQLIEQQKDYYNISDRYYELLLILQADQADDELYEMVEQDYSPEAFKELFKNPNEW